MLPLSAYSTVNMALNVPIAHRKTYNIVKQSYLSYRQQMVPFH